MVQWTNISRATRGIKIDQHKSGGDVTPTGVGLGNEEGKQSGAETVFSVFTGGHRLARSPQASPVAAAPAGVVGVTTRRGRRDLSPGFPESSPPGEGKAEKARRKAEHLHEFTKKNPNVHNRLKSMALSVRTATKNAEREFISVQKQVGELNDALKAALARIEHLETLVNARVETHSEEGLEVRGEASKVVLVDSETQTDGGNLKARPKKRDRDSPCADGERSQKRMDCGSSPEGLSDGGDLSDGNRSQITRSRNGNQGNRSSGEGGSGVRDAAAYSQSEGRSNLPAGSRNGNQGIGNQNSEQRDGGSTWRNVVGKKRRARNDNRSNKAEGANLDKTTNTKPKGRRGGTAPEVKGKPKPKRRQSRADALIVEAADQTQYAAILRKMRCDESLKGLGENVVRTRRTQKGSMIFELKRGPEGKSALYCGAVQEALKDVAKVTALSEESLIEASNIDEITTVEELEEALRSKCNLTEAPSSMKLRWARDRTQIALIRLSQESARQLLKVGKIKCGFAVVRFREAPKTPKQLERCYRCWGFGHRAQGCSGTDRSKCCLKCGEEGHKAADCKQQPKCVLCVGGRDHATGSFRCPAYQKAKACRPQ